MNYKLELQTSGGNFEATVYSACHCHASNAAVHKVLIVSSLTLHPPCVFAVTLSCMLVPEGLGDAPHELKTYKRTEGGGGGGGNGKSGGQLGGSKQLSADDEEVGLQCVAHAAENTLCADTGAVEH